MSGKKRVLVVASGGGHWTQMLLLRDAFSHHDVTYVGVKSMYRLDVAPRPFHVIPDFSRLRPWAILPAIAVLCFHMGRIRPDIVLTTGSAPGMLALRIGKLFRARTIWVDSVANCEALSLSGLKAAKYADLWLTQWPHLSRADGPIYLGSVL